MHSVRLALIAFLCCASLSAAEPDSVIPEAERRYSDPISLDIPHVSTDASVRLNYPIVYVRTPRKGDDVKSLWAEIAHPVQMDAGGDLMLLHPDGTEEVLVAGGAGSVADPVISLDGKWVIYSHIHDMTVNWAGRHPKAGADIYKLNLKTREIVRLTHQRFTPNTGAVDWSEDFVSREDGRTHLDYGVFNMGPYPLPGGRLVFTSNRDAFRPPKQTDRLCNCLSWTMTDRTWNALATSISEWRCIRWC